MTDLILDNVVCYNRLLYICDIGFYPGLDFGLGLDSRGRGQTLEAEAEAKTLEAEAETEAGDFGLEAEARPRGLTSLEVRLSYTTEISMIPASILLRFYETGPYSFWVLAQ